MKNTEVLPFGVSENLIDDLGISVDELKRFEAEVKKKMPMHHFRMMVMHGLMDDMLMALKEMSIPPHKVIPLLKGFMDEYIIPVLLQEAIEIEVPLGLDAEIVKMMDELGIKVTELARIQKEVIDEVGLDNFNKWLRMGRIYKIIDKGVDKNLVGIRLVRFIEDSIWDEMYEFFGEAKK